MDKLFRTLDNLQGHNVLVISDLAHEYEQKYDRDKTNIRFATMSGGTIGFGADFIIYTNITIPRNKIDAYFSEFQCSQLTRLRQKGQIIIL